MSADYLQAGITEDSPGTRIERLEETVAICRGLWQEGVFSFRGKHFQITEIEGLPKPAQQPHPPILIGGGGKRVLSIAAKNANIVGINPVLGSGAGVTFDGLSPLAVDEKVGHVRSSAGERFDSIELSVIAMRVHVGDGWQERRRLAADAFGSTPEELDRSPYIWIGDEERVIEHIHEIRERWGISYFALHGFEAMDQAAAVVGRVSGL